MNRQQRRLQRQGKRIFDTIRGRDPSCRFCEKPAVWWFPVDCRFEHLKCDPDNRCYTPAGVCEEHQRWWLETTEREYREHLRRRAGAN